ncbi:conserved hypothetical protein [Flaviramulus basaltis]|uniref:DUF2383 domain-containing protein n=1 Tax=Flaviramulus basaltis TaxID=369401 RepID=A0A1K2IBE6_9FLAO|nr:DUF2383 domain-containing protein [Flaviramulus basaltis]SFZ89566.1 conserved hypothetical protein [Flaviramulus basaltis]
MKYSEKIIEKLNDLLIMNYEVEKIYLEALKNVTDNTLKTFFRERGLERYEFSIELKNEIKILDGNPEQLGELSKDFYKVKMNFRNLIFLENQNDLLDEVFSLKKVSIDKYNQLLMEPNLPLQLCRILIKQRDSIQATMRVLKRESAFVA